MTKTRIEIRERLRYADGQVMARIELLEDLLAEVYRKLYLRGLDMGDWESRVRQALDDSSTAAPHEGEKQ